MSESSLITLENLNTVYTHIDNNFVKKVDVTAIMDFKGTCTGDELLAKTDMKKGDVWAVTQSSSDNPPTFKAGSEYVYTGTEWNELGPIRSEYVLKTQKVAGKALSGDVDLDKLSLKVGDTTIGSYDGSSSKTFSIEADSLNEGTFKVSCGDVTESVTLSHNTNIKNVDGYVKGPTEDAVKVWKTDASGNPDWRNEYAHPTDFTAKDVEALYTGTIANTGHYTANLLAFNKVISEGVTTGLITGMRSDKTYSEAEDDRMTLKASKVYNAVWNDLADCIDVDCELEYGRCYCFDGLHYFKSNKYCAENIIGIHSDTAGFEMGQKGGSNEMKCSVAGFVLAYVDKDYPVGTPLTSSKNGVLTKIRNKDRILHPERIIATFWKNEPNEEWHKLKVNNRKWVKIK